MTWYSLAVYQTLTLYESQFHRAGPNHRRAGDHHGDRCAEPDFGTPDLDDALHTRTAPHRLPPT